MWKLSAHLHDPIEGLQQAAHIRRTATANPVDEHPPLVQTIGNRKSVIVIDFVLVQGHMEDARLAAWITIRIGSAVTVAISVSGCAAISVHRLLAGLRVGRRTARSSLDFGVDGLGLGQVMAAIGQVVAAQDLQVHQVAEILQQAGGMRQGHALHGVLVDGQQLVAHLDLAVFVGNAT